MPTLTEVQSDPFAAPTGAKLTPVDRDPFAGDGATTPSGLAASAARGMAPYAAGALAGGAIGGPPGAAVGAGAVGLTQLALGLYNPIARHFGLTEAVSPQEATDKLMDLVGVKRPSTSAERVAESAASGVASAAGPALAAGEVAANTASPMIKGIAEKLAHRPVAQAVAGGTSGAASQEAAEHGAGPIGQTVAGMAGAAAPAVIGKTLGAAIAPKISAKAQELLDAGIQLTPGQIAGTIPKRAEEAAKSIPVSGSMIRAAEGRTLDSFNQATANKALEPIGITVPKDATGNDIVRFGQQQLSSAYNNLLSQMSFRSDQRFQSDVSRLQSMIRTLPDERQTQFQRIYGSLAQRIAPTGTMLGENLKIAQSELKTLSTMYKKSPLAGEQQLGHAIDALEDSVNEALRRQNPAQAKELDSIDASYAMFVRLERAASAAPTQAGRFTPGQLLGAIKAEEPSIRKRGFARGDGLLQKWGQTAYDVIGNRMPDSGTPERMMWDIGGAAGLGLVDPKLLGAMAATSVPYTKAGQAAVTSYMTPGTSRQALRTMIGGEYSPLPLLMSPASAAASALGTDQ